MYRRAGVEGGWGLGRITATRGAKGRAGSPGIFPGRFGARGASLPGAGHRGLIPRGRARWAKMERAQWSRDHQTNNIGLPCRGARRKTATSRPTDRPSDRPTDRPTPLSASTSSSSSSSSLLAARRSCRHRPTLLAANRDVVVDGHRLRARPRNWGELRGFRDPGPGTNIAALGSTEERSTAHATETKRKRERDEEASERAAR